MPAAAKPHPADGTWLNARKVLVLQGGGALGSFQAGVFEALQGELPHLDWVVGISIGAINAALIAGAPPDARVARLRAFWEQATSSLSAAPLWPGGDGRAAFNELSAANIALFGVPGFFAPRVPPAWLAPSGSMEALSLYDSRPLRSTLERLVDFDRINHPKTMRLTVGAVEVETGNSVIFDSRRERIGPEHILASGALPPGLPPVEIDGRLYWDGGIVSNTPLQFVLDEDPDVDTLIFQVDLFSARGPRPRTLRDVSEREKDIRYSSRTRLNTDMLRQAQRFKAAARSLIEALPPEMRGRDDVTYLAQASREPGVFIVQLIYRKQPYEGGSKDFEFSRQSMVDHWAAGVADIERYLPLLRRRLSAAVVPGMATLDPGQAAHAPGPEV